MTQDKYAEAKEEKEEEEIDELLSFAENLDFGKLTYYFYISLIII
jgi:hypothetical protein